MKTIALLLSFFFCISVMNAQKKPLENQKSKRIEKIINSDWTFNYFPTETADKGYEAIGFNDSRWMAVSLPHTWNTYETTGEFYPSLRKTAETDSPYWWMGWGWYRKHFTVNKEFSEKKISIEFEDVQKYCKVYINGKYLGEYKGSNGSSEFDITRYVRPGEDNVIAVAVNNSQNDTVLTKTDTSGSLNVYSGIVGDVTLLLTNKLYISIKGSVSHEGGIIVTTPKVSEKECIVHVQTWVINGDIQKKICTLQTTIYDAANKIVEVTKSDASINPGKLYLFDQTFKPIKKPHLWTVKNPYQYKIYSEVIDGTVVSDTYLSSLSLKLSKEEVSATESMTTTVHDILAESFIKHTSENSLVSAKEGTTGQPVKIVLSVSPKKMIADRGSVAVVTAEVVDSQGNKITGAKNTIKWMITGAATLAGPSVYEPDPENNHEVKGDWYTGLPATNVIRSTGKPGIIKITVLSSGLASGSVELQAEEKKQDNSVIKEPVLGDEGRKPVTRITLTSSRLEEVPREIGLTSDELNFKSADKKGLAREISDYLLRNNPAVDSSTVEFKTLIELFTLHLFHNNGQLVADDYNFDIDHYNNCRLIGSYINSTKLPPPFKEGLKRYYSTSIITEGSEKNAGEEMNWLNWIPSGGTVLMYQDGTSASGIKGVIVTNKSDLTDMISVVHPGFVNFSEEAKERALIFISKMNPYVYATPKADQGRGGDNQKNTNVSYKAEKGETILIPLKKFISE
ncbi:MAG: hypothetical protein EPN88_02935 [Bacteroidetes bacterium]|nr:MAG: hypothetical protein EPN88_02935 [Bacteroidota bacterium]